jgi:hypothetical protein
MSSLSKYVQGTSTICAYICRWPFGVVSKVSATKYELEMSIIHYAIRMFDTKFMAESIPFVQVSFTICISIRLDLQHD